MVTLREDSRSAEGVCSPSVFLTAPCGTALWHWVFNIPVRLSQDGTCFQSQNWDNAPYCARPRGKRCSQGSQLLVWDLDAAGVFWLFWDNPEMQGKGLAGLPLFFFFHCFHRDLGGRRAKPEDALSSPTPMTTASWISQVKLQFVLKKVIWYRISSRLKFLLLIKAPFK